MGVPLDQQPRRYHLGHTRRLRVHRRRPRADSSVGVRQGLWVGRSGAAPPAIWPVGVLWLLAALLFVASALVVVGGGRPRSGLEALIVSSGPTPSSVRWRTSSSWFLVVSLLGHSRRAGRSTVLRLRTAAARRDHLFRHRSGRSAPPGPVRSTSIRRRCQEAPRAQLPGQVPWGAWRPTVVGWLPPLSSTTTTSARCSDGLVARRHSLQALLYLGPAAHPVKARPC
jgi:hypothetical protein